MITCHRPWTVQWSAGPVAGSVSQNCVCSRLPPGELKQQVLATALLLWQLKGYSKVVHCSEKARAGLERRSAPTVEERIEV